MKKPIIGVTPLFDQERDSYWMLPGYLEGLEQAGAIQLSALCRRIGRSDPADLPV